MRRPVESRRAARSGMLPVGCSLLLSASALPGCSPQEPTVTGPGAAPTAASAGRPQVGASATADRSAGIAAATPTGSAAAAAVAAWPTFALAEQGPYRVVDLHTDTAWQVHFKGRSPALSEGHVTEDKLRAGGYAAIVLALYLPDYLHEEHPTVADAAAVMATIEKLVAAHGSLAFALPGPVPSDKVAVLLALEGAGAFAADLEAIDRFVARGVRMVSLTHAHDNALAGSATGNKRHGLTDLGKRFSARVYRAGALVDVSHLSDEAFADLVPIAAAAGAPIVASHSNARAVCAHRRNLTDEQLGTIARTGGVAGLNLYRGFVKTGRARLADVVAMAQHMVAVAGVDHVAIGSDFDGGTPVADLSDASRLPQLAEALRAAGMSDADTRKILGLNAGRVLGWGLR